MEVTLRRPAPLDYPVRVTRLGGDEVIFKADGTLIAETHLANLDLDVPVGHSFPGGQTVCRGQSCLD